MLNHFITYLQSIKERLFSKSIKPTVTGTTEINLNLLDTKAFYHSLEGYKLGLVQELIAKLTEQETELAQKVNKSKTYKDINNLQEISSKKRIVEQYLKSLQARKLSTHAEFLDEILKYNKETK